MNLTRHPLCLTLIAILFGLSLMAACQPPVSPPSDIEPPLATFTPTPTLTPIPTNTPTPRPSPTPTPQPSPTATVAPLAPVATATQPGPQRFQLTLSEVEINTMARNAVAQSAAAVNNVAVDLQPGRVVVSGVTKVGFLRVQVAVVATVPVVDGRPDPQIVEVRLGGQAVGGVLRQQVENTIQPYLDQFASTDLGVYVERIEITEDELRMEGVYQ